MNPAPQAVRPRAHLTPKQDLANIRIDSCYLTLRIVINVSAAIFMLLILAMIFGAAAGYATPFSRGSASDQILERLFTIGVWLVGLALVVAGRQMMLLLVDIADTLISEHNRNRNR